MCVDLCCGNSGMAQQLLNNPNISATIEQMRCKAVTEPVWTRMAGEISTNAIALYQPPNL